MSEQPVDRPVLAVLHFQWPDGGFGGLSRQDTYGPWNVDDELTYLAEIHDFILEWQQVTGIRPESVTIALVTGPAEALRQLAETKTEGR